MAVKSKKKADVETISTLFGEVEIKPDERVTSLAKLILSSLLRDIFSMVKTVAMELKPEEMVDMAAASTAVKTPPAIPEGRYSTINRGKIMSAFFSCERSIDELCFMLM